MSSIYQKGRDGYYYYQTYIYNPKTGKKNKRIFHALGTKDKSQAIEQQKQFDKKYESKTDKKLAILTIQPTKKKFKVFFILVSSISFYIVVHLIFLRKDSLDIEKNEYFDKSISNAKILLSDSLVNIDVKISTINEEEVLDTDSSLGELNIEAAKDDSIPNFTIHRVENISNAFSQGQIHITVDSNTSSEYLENICQKVVNDFPEFSNIIICLYSNNQIGERVAKGKLEEITLLDRKLSWLAMYTYNSVEGPYFDDNPSGYLGEK